MEFDSPIKSRRVVLPGGVRPASVAFRNGVITGVGSYDNPGALDFGDLVIMPGLVDTHVHINEPGRTEWEGFVTATRAAAAGGVTTLVDMPLNSVPATTSVDGLKAKLMRAEGQCFVDVGFWGGVIPGNAARIGPLWQAGCLGFKCFLAPSGVNEFPHVTSDDLARAMAQIAACGGVLLAHAEDPAYLREPAGDRRQYAAYLASRPRQAEHAAIETLLRLSHQTGCRLHIVHLSSSEAVKALAVARASNVPVTVETCPHYLVFEAGEIADGDTRFKCAPPIREAGNRDVLWGALKFGIIDGVVSDHSPCLPEMKPPGDFFTAWGGIASLELGLAAVWTEARRRGLGVEQIAQWMCTAPSRWAGLDRRKGAIERGRDADFAIWDPEASFTVDQEGLQQRHHLTPYAGRRLDGLVHHTILRGQPVNVNGSPFGRILRRGKLR